MESPIRSAAVRSATFRLAVKAVAAAIVLASTTAAQAQGEGQRSVFVHLFEWRWDDIARECAYLGEKGYAAVQVSPPNEHVQGTEWWTRYQPVSYLVASRSGDRAAFKEMVDSCHAAGVKIYVDAVINHTADRESGTGVAGTPYGRKNHPSPVYGVEHYHSECDIEDADYRGSQQDVQTCELVDLPDLDTGRADVQQKIADYNHDEQRHHPNDVVTFRDGPVNDLAHVLLLAWPYGYPKVMSSYWFPPGLRQRLGTTGGRRLPGRSADLQRHAHRQRRAPLGLRASLATDGQHGGVPKPHLAGLVHRQPLGQRRRCHRPRPRGSRLRRDQQRGLCDRRDALHRHGAGDLLQRDRR